MSPLERILLGDEDRMAYGTGSSAEMANQPAGLAQLIIGLYNSLGETAKKAIGNSQMAVETGVYNPAPVMEAAMLPMGTGAIAGVPMRAGDAVLGSGLIRGKKTGMDIPKELYHVVGPEYEAGQPLRSLYARKGNAAYDEFAKRWPDAGDMGQYHAHNTFFFDNIKDAQKHADWVDGKILKVDPSKVDDLYLDKLEKPGYWATKYDVPPDALSPFANLNSATAGVGPAGQPVFDDKLIDILRKYGIVVAPPVMHPLLSGTEEKS